MIFDFKFGSNRTAGSEDTIIFVAVHGPHRSIPLLVVSDFRVSYVRAYIRIAYRLCRAVLIARQVLLMFIGEREAACMKECAGLGRCQQTIVGRSIEDNYRN